MKRPTLLIAMLLVAVRLGFAQDPVTLSPNLYNVLLENEHVRVMEFRAKAGDKEPVHFHPAAVFYVLEGGKARLITDGKAEELDAKPGMAGWADAQTHAYEYLGPGEARILIVEMKNLRKSSGRSTQPNESAVRAELAVLRQRFAEVIKAGDAETSVSLWTEDAWAAEPGRPQPISGRAGMRQWLLDIYGAGRITNLALHPSDVTVHGDYAYETGHFIFTLQPAGAAAAINDQGHYFFEWHRGADGQWRARREVWNSAVPTAGQR